MALLKMGQAARRAGAGSASTIRRALQGAGIPILGASSASPEVEEEDLDRFLREHPDWKSEQKPSGEAGQGGGKGKPKKRKPDNRRR